MLTIAPGWTMDVDRGPDWLFVKVHPPHGDPFEMPPLAESVWQLLEQHLTYRVVLELDEVALLHSYLLGQLVLLSKRVHNHDGILRLCGLSPENQDVLETCRLNVGLPNYSDRGNAVMGQRPGQPR